MLQQDPVHLGICRERRDHLDQLGGCGACVRCVCQDAMRACSQRFRFIRT
jgi:hypothetical protein